MMTEAAAGMQRLITSMLNFAQIGHGEICVESMPATALIEAVRVWPLQHLLGLDRTRSSRSSARAGWGKSTGRTIRGWDAT